ncbi:class I SAM-dependent methyltransferase [Marinospirillum insulare]|uniref:Ribosomal RNA small subunit methyltransferase J n=1 Tax=Marinospirillum insulare TaxID=217169 RepID=A0ABQ5ZTF8_9GAMM|nr:class I SAM-dependent methyltransferase [Marinospirillum insulare]GLR63430.1 ribosomal RNA small subunit methyltransferase J [Marinospirillum insulare]
MALVTPSSVLVSTSELALAKLWAEKLNLLLVDRAPLSGLYLLYDQQGLALAHADLPKINPVRVDFSAGAMAHRLQQGGGRGQALAKACGLKQGVSPRVLDATLGLATDAVVLTSLGCQLLGIERHPWVAALVEDALNRVKGEADLAWLEEGFQLQAGDSTQAMASLASAASFEPQVVYLDPMFPSSDKTAQVKKEMRFFRDLVGKDLDADELLAQALDLASHRVVVKRPRKAPELAGKKPSFSLVGKANRFDVYALRSLQGK